MKKIICSFILLSLFLVGCTEKITEIKKETVDDTPTCHLVTIFADSGEDVKTAYSEDKYFSWVADEDKISVLYTDGENQPVWVEFTASSTAAKSAFTGLVDNTYTLGAPTTHTLWAIYPASTSHVYTNDTDIKCYVPNLRDGSTAKIPMIATATGTENNYHFHQLCGALKFTINNIRDEVSKVRVEFNTHGWESDGKGYKYVAGLFSVLNPGSDTPYISASPGFTQAATFITSATADVASHSAVVYIPGPMAQYYYSLYYNIYDADKDILLDTRSLSSGSVTFDKRKIYRSTINIPDVNRDKIIQIDGYFSYDWTKTDTGIQSFSSSKPGYIDSWKATSDATNIYLYFKIPKTRIAYETDSNSSAYLSYRYKTYIVSAFDYTNNDGTSTNGDAGYSLGSGYDARVTTFPFDGTKDTGLRFINGNESNSEIYNSYPFNSGNMSANHVKCAGELNGDYVYIEVSIARADIKAPKKGSISVQHSYAWGECGRQSISLFDISEAE